MMAATMAAKMVVSRDASTDVMMVGLLVHSSVIPWLARLLVNILLAMMVVYFWYF